MDRVLGQYMDKDSLEVLDELDKLNMFSRHKNYMRLKTLGMFPVPYGKAESNLYALIKI